MLDNKSNVLNFIRKNGPILPVHIAKEIGCSSILAGAILSELKEDGLIKISTAKIGGSPVYYIPGQEARLNILYDHLPGKEKQAYDLLKEKGVLRDRSQEPAIRVALRQIKDFAIPFKKDEEIYWKWYLKEETKKEEIKEPVKEKVEIKKEEKKEIIKPVVERKIVREKSELVKKVANYIRENNFEVVEEFDTKKKNEIDLIISINSQLGNLNFLLIAKDKKRISDADISLVYSKGQKKRLPVIFLSNGSLTKKAEKYIKDLGSYLIFKRIE